MGVSNGKGKADELDSLIIEKGDQIPKDIPAFRLEQETPLADAKLIHMSSQLITDGLQDPN